MIKFIAIGDPHIADRHMEMTIEALEGAYKVVEKRKDVDFVVVMGDVFDRHNNLKMEHMKIGFDWLQKLAKIKNTFVLIGNHDRVNNRDFLSDIHPFMGMNVENLYIVSRPTIMNMKKIGRSVMFVPYVPPGRFMEAINGYIDTKRKKEPGYHIRSVRDVDLIFAHQEFYDSPCGPVKSIKGDKWDLSYPMVISGHIHSRIRLQENILYTGSLYPITISESNDKGVLVGTYDCRTKNLDAGVTRVVTSTKEILRINASDNDGVTEMVALDRKNTKYIVQGTADEVASIKEKCRGKKLNVVYDVRPIMISMKDESFDEILSHLVTDSELKLLLAEIVG